MISVSACHIILTPAQPVGSGCRDWTYDFLTGSRALYPLSYRATPFQESIPQGQNYQVMSCSFCIIILNIERKALTIQSVIEILAVINCKAVHRILNLIFMYSNHGIWRWHKTCFEVMSCIHTWNSYLLFMNSDSINWLKMEKRLIALSIIQSIALCYTPTLNFNHLFYKLW